MTIGIVDLLRRNIGLAQDDQRRSGLRVPESFHRRQRHRLIARQHAALRVARRHNLQQAHEERDNHAHAHKDASLLDMFLAEQIKRAHSRHHKRSRNGRAAHVVRVLPPGPGIQYQLPEAGELYRAIGHALVAHGMLHPGVGGNDEVARHPRAQKHHQRRKPVQAFAQALLAIKEKPEECRLQKEREAAFHGQRLPDHPAGEAREVRPVGAELKFHRNASHHADDEIDAEDFCPEAGGLIVALVARLERDGFQDHDQRRQSHGQLREQVVIRDRKGKLQAVDQECAIHA